MKTISDRVIETASNLSASTYISRSVFFVEIGCDIPAGGRIDLKIGTQIGVKVFEGLRHVLAAVAEANVARFVVHASRKQHYA